MTTHRKIIGLVLSGGGVRGVAHVGVLKAFWEKGIRPTYFAGTSSGALVGLMAAAECSIEDMRKFWTESKPFQLKNISFSKPGVFDTTQYIALIKKYVPYDNFEELPGKLFIMVTAMVEGVPKIFHKGPIFPMVVASAAYPLVFSPIECSDEIYMDGGILDNFPVRTIREFCDILVGIDVSPLKRVSAEDLKTTRELTERVMDLRSHRDYRRKNSLCNVLISPEALREYGVFDLKAMDEIFEIGYESGLAAAPRILALLQKRQ